MTIRGICGISLLSAALLSLTMLGSTGCRAHSAAAVAQSNAAARADQQATLEDQREQMEQIPVSAKDRYMVIHSLDSWENPYLIVQAGMVELHVTRGDANPSTLGVGGMLRPVGARRIELNISDDRLAEAVAAVPPDAWPYGRVVAIEEPHRVPAAIEPMVRRNMEKTLATLSSLGVQAYDLSDGKLE